MKPEHEQRLAMGAGTDAIPRVPPPPPIEACPSADDRSLPMDERSLCDRALRGDVAAWNALVQKHNHRVVVSLLARGVRIDRAKDLAQDAWLRLIEQQREGRLAHLSLPGLAITQAGFLALEAARRVRRGEAIAATDDEAAKVVDPGADAETKLLAEEQLARAEAVLSRCSPSARKVFRLAYSGEGKSHADVAAEVGLSLQRVRQIICEVRKVLRAEIGFDEGAKQS